MFRNKHICLAALLAYALFTVSAAARYKQGDLITLWANKVGPFQNPTETYQFYNLPFCQPSKGREYKIEDLGEVLEGDRLVDTAYQLKFRTDVDNALLCTKKLGTEELRQFRYAVQQDYYFQMYYDDLPVWGFIGKVEKIIQTGQRKQYLFTHFHFDLFYNDDNVIEINVSSDPMRTVEITKEDSLEVQFSYSAKWKPTSITYEHRMDRYARYSFLPQHLEIHWFSIINSCVTVLLLTGFLATILLRVLKNDFLKYTKDDEMGTDEAEETGWKYLHGDVFRLPPHINLFAAMMGVGTQMLVVVMFIFALALVGVFYPYNRGALLSACVVLYALTAGIAGYVGGCYYKMMGGSSWVSNVLLTAGLFFGPVLVVFSYLNTVAICYRSTAALPFGTIVIITVVWALITFPLTVLGGIAAKNSKHEYTPPCRTTKFPRDVPPMPWYRTTVPQMVMAGFLPFSAIYIELYYIFASIWGHKVYTIYSILFIVFIILIIVTAFITVALTYFQLAVEDHRWWWRSFLCGGSTGFFIFGYCFYYYFARSDMSGLMQASVGSADGRPARSLPHDLVKCDTQATAAVLARRLASILATMAWSATRQSRWSDFEQAMWTFGGHLHSAVHLETLRSVATKGLAHECEVARAAQPC
ncbi:transmembrane 9 superfamily member [Haematococcus lacustris]|uniref:Transmembrane 9 superfamily member n=1 Tax=Haematococcus lacustris TaxID=44745 RepID=A0A699ZB25_HAELA|nr:transmembrane 9 superfamily member [Haematococcus lacustris]